MRVLFVGGTDFSGPSEQQVLLGISRELVARGHGVMLSILGDPTTAPPEAARGVTVHGHRFRGRRLHPDDRAAARAFDPDVVYSLTSRVPAVAAADDYASTTGARVFVHFEDDEWSLLKGFDGASVPRRLAWAVKRAGSAIHPPLWFHSTPTSLEWVRREAVALDALTPALATHVAEHLGRECATILPVPPQPAATNGSDGDLALPDLPDAEALAIYTGAIFVGNADDVLLGMRAVALARERGHDVAFVHTGRVLPPVDADSLVREAGLGPRSARFLGHLPFAAIPRLLRRGAVLLQPGAPTDFNRLRLPSKLEMYLPSGTPTITFATGFAELLSDRLEVLKTHTAESSELADRIVEVLDDAELRQTLKVNGPAAARRLFDPGRNTEALIEHFRRWQT